ncbi:MAG: outer membrane protein assembly factor BamD [Spirochaetia bacterium]|nr:outer membrane protein assembly factor BamD [Spirochaetia bacterium]
MIPLLIGASLLHASPFLYPVFPQGAKSNTDSNAENNAINSNDDNNSESSQKKDGPDKNYLEMAVNYINEKNFVLAKRYLQLASASSDEHVFQDASIWTMYIDSLEGKRNMDGPLNSLTGESSAKALYYISDGWQTYSEKNPESRDIYAASIEYKEKLVAQYPDSDWSKLVSMQLVSTFINQKDYDKALKYLIKYIGTGEGKMADHFSDDKAWFYMGKILENSKEYRDLHKALKSYQRVLKNPDSMFFAQARERISSIEKFYHIIPGAWAGTQ